MSNRQAELDQEKAEQLNNSALFDVHRWSDYPEVNNAVNALYEELKSLPEFRGREIPVLCGVLGGRSIRTENSMAGQKRNVLT